MAVERSPESITPPRRLSFAGALDGFADLARRKLIPGRSQLITELPSSPENEENKGLLEAIGERKALKLDQYARFDLSVVRRDGIINAHKQKIHKSTSLRKAVLAANPEFATTAKGKIRKPEVVQRKVDREIDKTIKAAIRGDEVGVTLSKWVQDSLATIGRQQQLRKSEVRKRGSRLRDVKELDKWASYIQNPDPIVSNLKAFKATAREYRGVSDKIQKLDELERRPKTDESQRVIENSRFVQHLRLNGLEFDLSKLGTAIPAELLGARVKTQLEWRLLKYAQQRGDINPEEMAEFRKMSSFARKSRAEDSQFNYGKWVPAMLLTFLAGTSVGFTHKYMPTVEAAAINFSPTPIVRMAPIPSSSLQIESPKVEKTPTPMAQISEKLKATFTALKSATSLRVAISTPFATRTREAISNLSERAKNIADVLTPTPRATLTLSPVRVSSSTPTIMAFVAEAARAADPTLTPTATRPATTPTVENSPTPSATNTAEPTKTPTKPPTNTPTRTPAPATSTATEKSIPPTLTPTEKPTQTPTKTEVPPTATNTKLPDTPTPAPTKPPEFTATSTVIVKPTEKPAPPKEDKKPQETRPGEYKVGNLVIYPKRSVALGKVVDIETFDVRLNGRAPAVTVEQIRKELLTFSPGFAAYAQAIYDAGVEFDVEPGAIMSKWRMENGYKNNSYFNNPGSIVFVARDWLPGMLPGEWNHGRRWANFPTFVDGLRAIPNLLAKEYFQPQYNQTDLWSIHSGVEGKNGLHAYHGWGDAYSLKFYLEFYGNWVDVAKRIASRKV